MIAPGESIHWVGNQATLESICNCVLGGASTKATDDADGQQWFISHGNDVCTSPDGPERVVGTGRYVFPNGIERVVTPAQNRLLIAFRKRRILTGEQLRQNAKIGDPIGVLKRLAREISPSNAIDLPSPDRPTGYRIFVRAEEIQPARTP
jgi:hypothetical protein